jgi:hypothetical protein
MVTFEDAYDVYGKLKPRAVLKCDECGKECEDLYENEDGQFCSECALEICFKRIEAYQVEEEAEETAYEQRWENDIVFASQQ